MTAAPKWATDLVARVCAREGVAEPVLDWRRSTMHTASSGRCNAYRIVVTAGKDRFGQRKTLVHELAHWCRRGTVGKGRWSHDDTFYRVMYRLAKDEGMSLTKVMQGEAWYRAQATRTAAALGIRGAKAEGRRQRKARSARPKYLRCPLGTACTVWGVTWIPAWDHTHAEGTVIRGPEGNVVVRKEAA